MVVDVVLEEVKVQCVLVFTGTEVNQATWLFGL